jgi:hypothetical protein
MTEIHAPARAGAGLGTTAGLPVPRRGLDVFDALLVLYALGCLVPPLVLGREIVWPLPLGQHLTAGLTARNLLAFWGLLYLRLHLRGRDEIPSWTVRLLAAAAYPTRALVLFGLLFLVYLNAAVPRCWPSGDTIPGKLLPVSLLTDGSLDLAAYRGGVPQARRYGFWEVEGRTYSAYPIAPSLTVLPVYAAAAAVFPGALETVRDVYAVPGADDGVNPANRLEQISSSGVTALAVALCWLLVRRVGGDERLAWLLALPLGLGTSLMSTAALALWQHGPACLALAALLLALARAEQTVPPRPGSAGPDCGGRSGVGHRVPGCGIVPLCLAGLAAGWAYACRPSLLVVPPLAALWTLQRCRGRVVYFAVPCAAIGLAVFAYNFAVFGRLTGGYARNLGIFSTWDGAAVLTMLFSPSRGLFFFSPFLLFALPGLMKALLRPRRLDGLCAWMALATLGLFSFWSTWAAGSSFGSRYLCEAALLLAVLPAFHGRFLLRRRWALEIFLLSALFSCHLHIVGGRAGDAGWTEHVFKPDNIAAAWSWRDSQAAYTLFRGPP